MSYQHLIWLYRYLWIAPHVLLLAVAAVMFRKKLHKQYPVFFSYLVFESIEFGAVFAMTQRVPLSLYVKVDFFGRIADATLSFAIVQELFSAALGSLDSMRKQMSHLLRWVTVALVLLGSLCIWALCYSRLNPAAFPDYWSIEALRAAQCGLLFLVFLWHRFLGVRMPLFSFGVAFGMALVAALDLLTLAFKTSIMLPHGLSIDILNMATYHAAVVCWFCFALAAKKNVASDLRPPLTQYRERAAELARVAR